MRTVIFGADGQLGRALTRAFKSGGEVRGYDRADADIADTSSLYRLLERFPPALIVNAAAYTDVAGAEEHLDLAFLVNEVGARNIADLAAYFKVPVLFFSTAGLERPLESFLSSGPNRPDGVYIQSKLAGEVATRRCSPLHYVIRTEWLYGRGANNAVEHIIDAADAGQTLSLPDDEMGSPTYTLDLAEAAYYLARTKAYGTYEVMNQGTCSPYTFARTVLQIAERDPAYIEAGKRGWAGVPEEAEPEGAVTMGSLEEATGHKMRPWKQALMAYMENRENAAA